MGKTVQARLDKRSWKTLTALFRAFGWSPSQAVREGLRILEATHLQRRKRGVVGLGKFRSGSPDLGSSKKHLQGFGK